MFLVHILLVPTYLDMQTHDHLYDGPFYTTPRIIGQRCLRDNRIIFLESMAISGMSRATAVRRCDDIMENVRNGMGYRLVVTCPVISCGGTADDLSLVLLLEMEF
jgi:hypothetical protein